MSSILDTIDNYLQQVDTSGGKISVNLTDTQSTWIVDNMVSFLQNADPKSTLRTNFLTKVVIPAAIKVYLPYTLIIVGTLLGTGYFIGRGRK